MEKLSILLIALFLILCIGQFYSREAFATADISNATVTMSLSDLLYYNSRPPVTAQTYNPFAGMPYNPYFSGDGSGYGYGYGYGGDLDSYLFLKNEMTREFKEKLKQTGGYSLNPVNVEPPSCSQGSSYMETVPLKVPASC
jgi:hypothetical protein